MAGPGAGLEGIPAEPGCYALHLVLPAAVRLGIGRLGEFTFPAGDYVYLGSARGAGGLRARLRHHARYAAQPRWHLDWLRPHAALAGGWYAAGLQNLECAWSQALICLPGASVLVPGFGAADCRRGCPAHLVSFRANIDLESIADRLRASEKNLHPFRIPPHPSPNNRVKWEHFA